MGHSRTRSAVEYRCFADRRPVIIPPRADVAPDFRQNGRYARLVAEVLRLIPQFSGPDFTDTVTEFDTLMPLRAVQISAANRVVWGQRVDHQAARPGLSPFVMLDPMPLTTALTVQLVMNGRSPFLVRAYAGEVEAPLPWMKSAHDYDQGGKKGCEHYWRRHAYVLRRGVMRPGTQTQVPPDWARR